MKRKLAGAGAALVLALSLGLVAAQPTVSSWRPVPVEAGLPANVEMTRSADRRCSFAEVTTKEPPPEQKALEAALPAALERAGFTASKGAKRGNFERGEVAGRYVLVRGEDSDDKPWHLRACFYRKRDENVCKSSCEKLL